MKRGIGRKGPRRIFVEAHALDHGFDGAASFIQGVYSALVREFPGEYRLFFGCNHPVQVMAAFPPSADIEVVEYRGHNRYGRLLVDIPLAIRKVDADFAHFQYFTPLVKTCPWIVTIHDVLFNDFPQYFPPNYRRLRNVLFPLSARRADVLTTVSEYSRQRIAHWYRVPPALMSVLPNGIRIPDGKASTDKAQSQTVSSLLHHRPGYIVCVSRFEPRKNQALLLQAFLKGRLWEQGLRLVYVGSRTLPAPQFDDLLASAPVVARDSVSLLSNLTAADLDLLYGHAVVAVYPSFAEGFGIPPLEAAVRGTPSLCANNTAMLDFGFLQPFFFNPASSDDLLKKLRWVIGDQVHARELARALVSHVQSEYTWSKSARLLHALITEN